MCFTRKNQNGYSLDKEKRVPFGDRYGLKCLENVSNRQPDSEHKHKLSSGMSMSMIAKTDKKGYSLNKHHNSSSQNYQNYQSHTFSI